MRNANCEIADMGLDSPAERLRWAREQHGKYSTPTEAARAFGWTVSTYLGHENGDRSPSRDAARRYARAYRVRWEWLLDNEGQPINGAPIVKIIGQVDAGGKVAFYDAEKVKDCGDNPPHDGVATVAVEAGASLRGVAESGWLYFFDHEKKPPSQDLIGKLCVVALKDGDVLIRVLQPGRKRGRYDLESSTEPTLRDRQLDWAARITWIKPR
jgi:transcriptional regulator with XRE-family HTH domain